MDFKELTLPTSLKTIETNGEADSGATQPVPDFKELTLPTSLKDRGVTGDGDNLAQTGLEYGLG